MCAFCRIISGEAPAHVVYDDDVLVAFLDNRPLFPGHSLVVPRAHRACLFDMAPDEVGRLFAAAARLSGAVAAACDAHGSFLALNDRVSQSVPHVHVHVVPRRHKDGLRGFFWPRSRYGSDDEMAAVAARVRAALAGS